MDELAARENLLWTLERLAEKATAGPWFSQGGLIHAPDKGGIDVGALRAEVFEDEPWSNATYIVALLNAAPELIAALRAATADKPLTREVGVMDERTLREELAELARLREALRAYQRAVIQVPGIEDGRSYEPWQERLRRVIERYGGVR
jgi:hypothetical protein